MHARLDSRRRSAGHPLRQGRGWLAALALTALAATAGTATAAGTDAAKLGGALTPLGAEPGASADGSVAAWTPMAQPLPGWSHGKPRRDFWRHKDDKPLYTIDESSVDKHAAKLSPGHVEMLKKIKGYRMEVYPSRRTCAVPDFVAENTKKNVGFAKLDKDGLALDDAHLPGTPFPMPTTGAEVMLNMKMRYHGVGFDMPNNIAAISPRKGSSDWLKLVTDQVGYYPWGGKGGTLFSKVGRVEANGYFLYAEPAGLAGQAGILLGKTAEPSEAFYYFPGQRRVRRMPAYNYDAPQLGLDNQYTVDEIAVFSGQLDRFDWKLVGKRELVVPYNSFALLDFNAKFDDVVQRDFLNPQRVRYESHRVWVVEATVRAGMRHQAPKRLFYIDEDTWSPLVAVDFDAQGRVWKVREGHLMPAYEIASCDVQPFVQYNLIDGRYLFDSASVGTGKDHRWLVEPGSNVRMKPDFYTSENLRSISER